MKRCFERCLATAMALLMLVCCGMPTVMAEGEPVVTLAASERTVHSGGTFTLTASLSSACAKDIRVAVSDGSRMLEVPVAAGETSGALAVTVEDYPQTTSIAYSVQAGTGYAGGKGTQITVLPSPSLAFPASIGVASEGRTMTVNVFCRNADQMTIPLPASLRDENGTVLSSFSFDALHSTCQCEFSSPDAAAFSHRLYLYNDITGQSCASMPVAVFAPSRPGIRQVEAKGKIALGFDCGYGNRYTEYILDMLDEYQAKATFFVTGYFIQGFPEMLREIHERGHEIGNHTMTHPRLGGMAELSEIYREIEGVNQGVYDTVGVRPRVMRPPFGSCSVDAAAVSRMTCCEVVYWTMDSLDWDPDCPAERIIRRATENMGEGCIILFHNSAPKTEETLRAILEDYKAKGLEIVSVSELLYPSHYTIDEDGLQRLDPAYEMVAPSSLLDGMTLTAPVTGGEEAMEVPLRAAVDDDALQCRRKDALKLLREHPDRWEVRYSFGNSLTAPVKAGESVGTATFIYEGEEWFTAALTADADAKTAGGILAPSQDGAKALLPVLAVFGGIALAAGGWLLARRIIKRGGAQ